MRISDWSSDVCSSDLDPLDAAVVAGVHPDLVLGAGRQVEQRVGHVELRGRGLAPGEIEGEVLALQSLIGSTLFGEKRSELLSGAVVEGLDVRVRLGHGSHASMSGRRRGKHATAGDG